MAISSWDIDIDNEIGGSVLLNLYSRSVYCKLMTVLCSDYFVHARTVAGGLLTLFCLKEDLAVLRPNVSLLAPALWED
jgi:hypothetical protein